MLLRLRSRLAVPEGKHSDRSGITGHPHLLLVASFVRNVLTLQLSVQLFVQMTVHCVCLCMLRSVALSSLGCQGVQSSQRFICYLNSCMEAPAGAAVPICGRKEKKRLQILASI